MLSPTIGTKSTWQTKNIIGLEATGYGLSEESLEMGHCSNMPINSYETKR